MAYRVTTRLDDFPIPADVRADPSWPPILLDMAAHVGAYAALLIVDAYAGQEIVVPLNPARSPFTDIVGAETAATLSRVYGRERLRIPSGRRHLDKVRRAGIVAAVRNNSMTVANAAALLRMAVRHLSYIVNSTPEATDAQPVALLERSRDARQLEMFDSPGD